MSQDDSTTTAPASIKVTHSILGKPLNQLLQRKVFIASLLLVVLGVTIAIGVILFRNSQSQKTSQSTASFSQTPPVNLKTDYQNPFDKSATYSNPFENLK